MEVTLRLSSLLGNWAVVLSFFQECTSLQYFQVKVENKSENLEIVRGDTLRNTASVFLRKKAVLSLGCSHLYYPSKMHSEMLDLQCTLGSHEVVPCIILIMTDNAEIYNIDWRQFFNFYDQLKGLTEHCLEYDLSMDALLSVVKSVPGLKGMNLALRFLTVDGAFSIVQLMLTCPSLHKIEESDSETNSVSTDHSDSSESTDSSESDSETNSISSDHSDTCSSTNSVSEEIENYELDLCSELIVRKNASNKFKLSLRCNSSDPDTKAVLAYISLILTEYTEESEIDWRCFFQSYYDSKGSTERSTDFDGKVNNILRFLQDVSGLKEVEMGIHSLTETWASCILHLCYANNSIDNICLLLEKEKDMESACSSFTIRRNHIDSTVTVEIQRVKHTETSPSLISFKVPDSEICNINGHDLLHRMRCLKCINDKPLEYEEGINKLMSLLHGIPGLQELELEIGTLTRSWANRILTFSTCPSLNKICVKGHMLMEDAILTIQNDWKRDCIVVLKGLLLEKEKDMESACLSCTIKRNLTDSTVTLKIQRVKHQKTSPSLISFKVPDSEISNINGHDLLHRMRCPKCINDKSYNYEEEMNKLMSFLHGIPGLQKLKLKIGNLTRSWATQILSFSTCPSLNKICVKGHMLMEDAILKIKKKWKRRDCVVVLKGLRCSNSTDRCTEEYWSPESFQSCNKKVKLSLCRGCFSELDESYSESEIDIYKEVFEGYEDFREPEWDDEEM
ncbi:uncharacterized protein LOC118801312 isoform X2 [Colossoma macropomum]|uniref:uncharacterized protein LOC118801312 isoform X2 n=1 Tax=Colossoma macropomum TaxID=42526 RepID=UPI001864B128|nr:uncharacterized protein LOC118801312 isoform X2 [Colossoma macropomum]